MNTIKVVVKVKRSDFRAPEYVQRIDRTPVQMTTDRKRALVMGRLTAEDVVKSIQTLQRIPELASVEVGAGRVLNTAHLSTNCH